mmetsp:Transcript_25419/g.85003  ORF Transcript_25419/g.85003 Transcript_25419/m.85003 type:complete len:391 (-) Transcript_25419:209-1381(-)
MTSVPDQSAVQTSLLVANAHLTGWSPCEPNFIVLVQVMPYSTFFLEGFLFGSFFGTAPLEGGRLALEADAGAGPAAAADAAAEGATEDGAAEPVGEAGGCAGIEAAAACNNAAVATANSRSATPSSTPPKAPSAAASSTGPPDTSSGGLTTLAMLASSSERSSNGSPAPSAPPSPTAASTSASSSSLSSMAASSTSCASSSAASAAGAGAWALASERTAVLWLCSCRTNASAWPWASRMRAASFSAYCFCKSSSIAFMRKHTACCVPGLTGSLPVPLGPPEGLEEGLLPLSDSLWDSADSPATSAEVLIPGGIILAPWPSSPAEADRGIKGGGGLLLLSLALLAAADLSPGGPCSEATEAADCSGVAAAPAPLPPFGSGGSDRRFWFGRR